MSLGTCGLIFVLILLQAIRDGMSKAQQEISGAQTEQARAEAQIAAECLEALDKAISKS